MQFLLDSEFLIQKIDQVYNLNLRTDVAYVKLLKFLEVENMNDGEIEE